MLAQQNMVVGFPEVKKICYCEECVYGKLAKLPFNSSKSWRARHKLQLIHADVCGPMQTESIGGGKYFLLFVDDFSRM